MDISIQRVLYLNDIYRTKPQCQVKTGIYPNHLHTVLECWSTMLYYWANRNEAQTLVYYSQGHSKTTGQMAHQQGIMSSFSKANRTTIQHRHSLCVQSRLLNNSGLFTMTWLFSTTCPLQMVSIRSVLVQNYIAHVTLCLNTKYIFPLLVFNGTYPDICIPTQFAEQITQTIAQYYCIGATEVLRLLSLLASLFCKFNLGCYYDYVA